MDQDVVLGEVGTLLRNIDVLDAAVGGVQVVFESSQLLLIHVQGRLIGTHRRTLGSQRIDGSLHISEGRHRVAGRGDIGRVCSRSVEGGRRQVDRRIRETGPFAVDRHLDAVAPEHTHSIEVAGGGARDEVLQIDELVVVKTPVDIALGGVLSQHGQLAHAIQSLGHLLQIAVLGLRERQSVPDVVAGGSDAADLGIEADGNREPCGVVRGVDQLGAGGEPAEGSRQRILGLEEVAGGSER